MRSAGTIFPHPFDRGKEYFLVKQGKNGRAEFFTRIFSGKRMEVESFASNMDQVELLSCSGFAGMVAYC